MTAHKLPPAAIHKHTAVSWGPRTKTKAARVHTVTAALAMTTQDSNRITTLTRHAPARRDNGAGSRAGAAGRARSQPDPAAALRWPPGCQLARTR
jgi:hypothetical protein